MKKAFFIIVLLVAAPAGAADQSAQQSQSPCNAAYEAANRARENEIKLAAEQYSIAQQSQRPLTGSTGGLGGCLEKYKDISIAGGLGVPNTGQIFDRLLKTASSAVCNGIDSAYSNIARQTSKEVVLPGGIAGGKVSLPTASQIPWVANDPVKVTTTNPPVVNNVEQKARDEVRGIFK